MLARVSTKEQESIPAQLEKLNRYVKDKNLNLIQTVELAESSTKDTRKEFRKVIEIIQNHDEPIALIVETIDRLQRSFKESVELDELRKQGKLELHFYRENLVLDNNSNSSDLLRWDMGVMFARGYVLQLSDNVKRSIDKKLADGEFPAPAPLGYINVNLADGSISTKQTRKDGKKWIEPDPERKHLIIKAFELYASGQYSIKALAKEMRKLGLTSKSSNPISTSVLYDILNNPFYYGEMRYKGKTGKHKYEPLITKWQFDKCQQVQASWKKKPFKYGAKEWVFKGLITCSECNHLLSNYASKGIHYVRCHNCKGTHTTEDELIKQVSGIFKSFVIPDEVLEELTQILRENHSREQDYYESNLQAIRSKLTRIQKRMRVMYQDRLDGRITTDEYDKMIMEMKAEEQDLIEQIKEHSKADETFLITSSYLLELANRAYELFESSQAHQKRKLISFVFANLEAKAGNLLFKLKNPFAGLVLCNNSSKWLLGLDSNQ